MKFVQDTLYVARSPNPLVGGHGALSMRRWVRFLRVKATLCAAGATKIPKLSSLSLCGIYRLTLRGSAASEACERWVVLIPGTSHFRVRFLHFDRLPPATLVLMVMSACTSRLSPESWGGKSGQSASNEVS